MSTKLTEQDKDANPQNAHPESDYAGGNADEEVPVQQDEQIDEPDPVKADSDEQLRKSLLAL